MCHEDMLTHSSLNEQSDSDMLGTRPLLSPGAEVDDIEFCITLTKEAGVTLIPVSAFYASKDQPRHLVRFCFCKDDEKLKRGCDLLEQHFGAKLVAA